MRSKELSPKSWWEMVCDFKRLVLRQEHHCAEDMREHCTSLLRYFPGIGWCGPKLAHLFEELYAGFPTNVTTIVDGNIVWKQPR